MANHWWQVWIFNPYGNFNVKRQGRIDGKLAIPPWTSEQQPDFLRELYYLTQTTLESLAETWHKADCFLKRIWVAATLRQQQAEKEFIEAADREEQAQQHHDEVHGRRLAVPDSRKRKCCYWALSAFLFICEFPLNAIVFQQLGVSTYETWVMTGAIAMAFVVCAHHLGRQLHRPIMGHTLHIVSRVLLAGVPFIAIVFVAFLRSDHMQQQALSHLNPAQLLGSNLVFNVLIFWMLTYSSYTLHDPVVEAVMKALDARRSKEVQLHLAEKATASARINRQKAHQQVLQDATGWVSEVRRRASLYRRTHIRVRPDRDQNGTPVPEWFNRESDITIPDVLTQLEWNITAGAVDQKVPQISLSALTTR